MTRNLKISLLISILFVGLIRLTPVWERKPGGLWTLLFFLAIAVLFFWLAIKIIKEVLILIRQRKTLTYKIFFPITIMTLFLLDGIYNPMKIDIDKMYGNVIFRACYEGTQNQATFKLRDTGKFDIHWTGVFFADNYFTGDYKMKEDTLFMKFDTKIPKILDDTLVIKNEYLCRIESDTLVSTFFYVGECKGLN